MGLTKNIYRGAVKHALFMLEMGSTEDEILYSIKEELCELTDGEGNYYSDTRLTNIANKAFNQALPIRYAKGWI